MQKLWKRRRGSKDSQHLAQITGQVALTDDEHYAMATSSDLANAIHNGMGVTGNDWKEIMAHIHAIQRGILAQAACRAYPGSYRVLQGTEAPKTS